jgi:hypothetical protein
MCNSRTFAADVKSKWMSRKFSTTSQCGVIHERNIVQDADGVDKDYRMKT